MIFTGTVKSMEAAGGEHGTVGVIVQRTNPTSRLEANWAVGQQQSSRQFSGAVQY